MGNFVLKCAYLFLIDQEQTKIKKNKRLWPNSGFGQGIEVDYGLNTVVDLI